ncbi:MAG: hypothetical protein KatS3mg061_1901 [Dehalococcoidia bacterium]|nr:MAG: hypothetical protein KatS3mg061_1901 [Dehalococcoidia bacterium]
MWNRADVDFIQTQELPWTLVPPGDFGSGGGLKRVLSWDPEDGAETQLLQFRNRQVGVLAAGADLYVLQGSGLLNGQPFHPGHYFYLPPGTFMDCVPGLPRTLFYAGFFGPPRLLAAESRQRDVQHLDLETLPWSTPEWNGDTPLEPGVMVKWVRRDSAGTVYLAAMLPGWKSPLEEAHPVCEESFKLYGDMLMGSRGVMRPGAYFFRSANVFHGPLYTRTGTLSFIRSSGPTTTVYREPGPGSRWDELATGAYADYPHPAI